MSKVLMLVEGPTERAVVQQVVAHAPIICGRIGVERIRRACPHFDRWLSQLEKLQER